MYCIDSHIVNVNSKSLEHIEQIVQLYLQLCSVLKLATPTSLLYYTKLTIFLNNYTARHAHVTFYRRRQVNLVQDYCILTCVCLRLDLSVA